jgi:hypothetical protein
MWTLEYVLSWNWLFTNGTVDITSQNDNLIIRYFHGFYELCKHHRAVNVTAVNVMTPSHLKLYVYQIHTTKCTVSEIPRCPGISQFITKTNSCNAEKHLTWHIPLICRHVITDVDLTVIGSKIIGAHCSVWSHCLEQQLLHWCHPGPYNKHEELYKGLHSSQLYSAY